MNHMKNKVEWCLKKAEKELKKEGKHKGLIRIAALSLQVRMVR